MSPDLPFYYWTLNERYRDGEEYESFDAAPENSDDQNPDSHPLRLHRLNINRREDSSAQEEHFYQQEIKQVSDKGYIGLLLNCQMHVHDPLKLKLVVLGCPSQKRNGLKYSAEDLL